MLAQGLIVMVDLDVLSRLFFAFDEPVIYGVQNNATVTISPIPITKSEQFLSSVDVIRYDKNSSSSVEIIQMSYLDFLLRVLLRGEDADKYNIKLSIILQYCLGIKDWYLTIGENNKAVLIDKETGITITHKQFEDIRRIILYQNILHYNDEYVDPELKKAMDDVDRVKGRNIVPPSLERKMAIITAHCGLDKERQKTYTLRSHQALFEECVGEIDFLTVRPVSIYAGKEIAHYIYPKKKDKYDGYFTSVEKYNKSMGGNGNIKSVIVAE